LILDGPPRHPPQRAVSGPQPGPGGQLFTPWL